VHGADAVGRNAWVVTSACQPERELITQALRDIDESASLPRELYDSEIKHATTGHWYHVRERAIRWVDGRIVRMQIATDITDRKNVDEERRQQSLRLQQTSRLITMGEMASSLAHELNQPLAAIANYSSGCAQRLESGRYDAAELLAAMHKAAGQAERAGKIIRRVREFVRKSEPNCAAVALEQIVEDVVGFADIEARKSQVRIRVDIEPRLPEVYVDAIMVEQVLLNLMKNGVEAMQKTPAPRRLLQIAARRNPQGMAELAVIDHGHGVSEEDKEKMFEPFYTTKHEGMGMGLNICRTIIEFHNGRLWVEPNPGGGSIFRFTVPFATALPARQAVRP
jgi:C4-dicarboxylate-specific signal transduction histidine kinase